MFVSRNVTGGPGAYSSGSTISRKAYINSFGGFGGTSGVSVNLTSSVKGPAGTCPGSNCPRVTLSPSTVTVFSGGSPSANLTISTNAAPNTPCGNPTQTSQIVYNVTIIATYGSTQHSLVFPLYIYGKADVDKSGVNNIIDLVLVAGRFGTTSSSPTWDPNRDFNNDAKIDIVDLSTIGSQFGKTSSSDGGSTC